VAVGKVYLVGAGPGHPELLTLKALELLRTADIVVYDRLIQEDTLALIRPGAERIYVGKAPSRHQRRQDEVNTILVDAAQRATRVVRLKGGDPVLFGRGGEEAEHLALNGVPFEIVPGVTAGLSVPIAAGIPVTHRDCAHTVALVTGHRRDDLGPMSEEELDWGALARIDTVVFFMGVHKLREITQRLMAHGRAPTTPAAVIQMAYWPEEQVVIGTLRDLPDLAQRAQVVPPATIVVGEVVRLRERLTTLHRDLRRDRSERSRFGLASAELLARVVALQRGAADVRAAVALRLFDDLEEAQSAAVLGERRALAVAPLGELLANLASLGLLARDGGTYRNTEAASRYLHTRSAEYLGDRLRAMLDEASSYDPLARLAGQGP
jgi:uroporphyrin-III C-methyltransferase